MPLLPFADKAHIPIEKLRDYALNENHEEGKNKAYFKARLPYQHYPKNGL